jgi:hypothetical protein
MTTKQDELDMVSVLAFAMASRHRVPILTEHKRRYVGPSREEQNRLAKREKMKRKMSKLSRKKNRK